MVRGLAFFAERFADYGDQYVLIGGTAAHTVMGEADLEFRATKDLDIVLVVEALTKDFAEHFWAFIKEGKYERCQRSETDKPRFYRFQKPADERFPVMVELFARQPDLPHPIGDDSHLTPIPTDEAVSSLSAILLNDDYYHFILAGRHEVAGLMLVKEDRLIPLKALAWMENAARKAAGHEVKSVDVRKHLYDVMRLSQLLTQDTLILLPERITGDMRRFLEAADKEEIDFKALGLGRSTLADVLGRIGQAYGLLAEPATVPAV